MHLLEELRLQRELIRKHLKWLDKKIDALESDKGKHAASVTEKIANIQVSSPGGVVESEKNHELRPEQDKKDEQKCGNRKAPTGNEILRAKFGCFILFIFGTLLFLFLLFGLPYLMN